MTAEMVAEMVAVPNKDKPLGPPPPEGAEMQSLAEMSEVLEGFKARAARESQRLADATDSEYWFAVCFQTRAQKEEMLQKLGLLADGDSAKYIDGLALAAPFGITITSPTPPMPKLKIDPKLTRLSREAKR